LVLLSILFHCNARLRAMKWNKAKYMTTLVVCSRDKSGNPSDDNKGNQGPPDKWINRSTDHHNDAKTVLQEQLRGYEQKKQTLNQY